MRHDEKFGRFKDAIWFPEAGSYVLIGGAGGIGSWLTLLLTRAGFSPIVYDFDVIEGHNTGGQFYGHSQKNLLKVDALTANIKYFTGETIQVFDERMDEHTMTSKICFSAFDNMEARRAMFTAWKKAYGNQPDAIFIDGRLTLEQLTILCVIGGTERVAEYETHHLPTDNEVDDTACTLKQTSHTATMIASFMTSFFTNFRYNLKTGTEMGYVPFYWEYYTPLGLLSLEPSFPQIEEENVSDNNDEEGRTV